MTDFEININIYAQSEIVTQKKDLTSEDKLITGQQ